MTSFSIASLSESYKIIINVLFVQSFKMFSIIIRKKKKKYLALMIAEKFIRTYLTGIIKVRERENEREKVLYRV